MLPERVFVPVPVTVKPLPGAVPLTIAPVMLMFAVPPRVTVPEFVFVDRLKPLISRVFPAPLAVIVNPFWVAAPIVNFVPVPNKFTVLEPVKVTVPVPRSRLFVAVLFDDPKVSAVVLFQVIALLPAFTTAEPLVLSIVAPPVRVKSPVPRALLLLMFKAPAVSVTPPDAAELLPLKVNVPFVAFIVVSPV